MGGILNVACWSLGQHAIRNVLPAFKRSSKVNLVGLSTRDQAKAKECAERFSCLVYTSAEQMLTDENVDAVYISSPTGVHAEQVRSSLCHGKHVLVEKTAFSSLAQTRELVNLGKSRNLVVMEAFMYRFHQQFKLLENLVDSGKYGRLKEVSCRFGFPHLDRNNIRYNDKLAGGALNDAGAYTLSSARLLLGDDTDVVWSSVDRASGYEVDTSGAAVLMSGSGVVANCSWGFGFSYVNEIRLWCEKAHIVVDRAYSKPDTFDSSVLVFSNGEIVETLNSGCDNHFASLADYFSDVCQFGSYTVEYDELVKQAELMEVVRSST